MPGLTLDAFAEAVPGEVKTRVTFREFRAGRSRAFQATLTTPNSRFDSS